MEWDSGVGQAAADFFGRMRWKKVVTEGRVANGQ